MEEGGGSNKDSGTSGGAGSRDGAGEVVGSAGEVD